MKLYFTILFYIAIALSIFSQDGVLDNTFSGDGIAMAGVGSSDDVGNCIAIQTNGKIIIAGYSNIGGSNDFSVVRFNSDGSLDTGFDSDGKATISIGSSDDFGYSVAVQSDGKIVIGGHSYNGSNYDFAVVRLNSDGSLDSDFDGDGKVTTAIGSGNDYGVSLAIQSDGKIVLAGYSFAVSDNNFAVVRYNSDGSLDTGFSLDGKTTTPINSNDDYGRSVAIQSNGKIVVAGYTTGISSDFAVARYNSNGDLDTGFGTNGIVVTSIASGSDYAYDVTIQSDGKIIAAGFYYSGGYDFAVVRYNSNGSLDSGFDGDGIVTTPVGSYTDEGHGVALQTDGKIIVTGFAMKGDYTYDFATVRYNSDGSLDTGFDTDGKVMTSVSNDNDFGYGVAVQSDGRILIGGNAYNNAAGYDFAVIRYNNPSLPVELTSFTVNQKNDKIVLFWETATEVNNFGFDIERKSLNTGAFSFGRLSLTDNWETIGFVEGSGNSNSIREYSFADCKVPEGKYLYRLKQIDLDGSFSYSETVEITFNSQHLAYELFQNYPNPFNPATKIKYSLPKTETVLLRMYDLLGSEVAVLVNGVQNPGVYEIEFVGNNLPAGVYFYKLQTDNFTDYKKLILLK